MKRDWDERKESYNNLKWNFRRFCKVCRGRDNSTRQILANMSRQSGTRRGRNVKNWEVCRGRLRFDAAKVSEYLWLTESLHTHKRSRRQERSEPSRSFAKVASFRLKKKKEMEADGKREKVMQASREEEISEAEKQSRRSRPDAGKHKSACRLVLYKRGKLFFKRGFFFGSGGGRGEE